MGSESPDNIANLIAKPVEKHEQEPRYVSKYRSSIIRESKRGKSAHKTLGVASVDLGRPDEFLRKRSGSVPKRPSVHHEHYRRPDYQRKLPEWQPIKAGDEEKRMTRSSVDFRKRNLEEAKNLRPSKVRMYYVDDRHGTSKPLKPSGMYPHYVNKKSYGVPPGRNSNGIERPSMQRSSPRRETGEQNKSRGDRKPEENKRHDRRMSPARRAKESFSHKESEKRKSNERKGRPKERKEKTKEREGKAKDGKDKSRRGASPRSANNEKIDKSRKKSKQPKEVGETEADDGTKMNGDAEGSEGYAQGERESRGSTASTGEEHSRTESKTDDEEEDEETGEEEDSRSRSTSEKSETEEIASTARTPEYQQPRCRYVTEDERAELLYGMKKKWDEMMKQFQGLPFLTDTQPKVRKKSRMERDLLQLEKDIETIERHPYIYVYSDLEE